MNAPLTIPPNWRKLLEQLVGNGLIDLANEKIKAWKLKITITPDGRLLEIGDSTEGWLGRFITQNEQMLAMKDRVRKIAKVNDDVLIIGPTGTGKELIARALHGDNEHKFLALNCAGLPSQLVESELFGHMQGSFTGATSTKDGLMKAVGQGTLFLDEVGELDIAVQAKLLRAIQDRSIRKVGDTKEQKIECRIICATHRDLWQMEQDNKFRLDLLARISTLLIRTTSLAERPEDWIPILNSIPGGPEFVSKAFAADRKPMLDLRFNVRSLQQYVRRYVVLGELP